MHTQRCVVLSGLTVALALALVPDAVAFAFVAGVEPLVEVNLMEDPIPRGGRPAGLMPASVRLLG